MAFQNTNPFYGSSGGGIPASGNQQRLALDNLIRRELKVGDPNDPKQIADALLNRFKDDPRANAITQEAKGLPFLQSSSSVPMMVQAPTSSGTEWQQAIDDVNRDLEELTTNAVLKDIKAELQGWSSAIRTAITEGLSSARFALDTRQRDKVFGIRRTLGDYARLARLVGALTPVLNINYRKLAQSLDEVTSLLLVLMGEALANVGFNGGRFLMQVPYSELQIRRDAAINALRNLTGSAQEAYANSGEWARGVGAYRRLYSTLEAHGQGDLRALLVENELMRLMDALIQRASQGSVEGLRQLGVTAQVEVERFRRLVFIAQNNGDYAAPPLAAFLDALLLFAEAFDASGGRRLLTIARPTILFYGLYGIGQMDRAEQRLVRLIVQRGVLAEKLDYFLQRGSSRDQAKTQILLDKILYDVDRAIDLYAVGTADFGEPEQRASAYGDLIEQINHEVFASSIEVRGSGKGFISLPSDGQRSSVRFRGEAARLADNPTTTTERVGFNSDECFFANMDLNLSEYRGAITAQITNIENIGPYTLAGLMIRADVGNGAPFAMVALTASHGVLFGCRLERGNTSIWEPIEASETKEDAPYWLRLEWQLAKDQSDNDIVNIKAYKSEDGANWYLAGEIDFPVTIPLIKVGLAVTAAIGSESPGIPNYLATATFYNVVVEGAKASGRQSDDWNQQDIGNPKVPGYADFSESYLKLVLREEYELRDALERIKALLQPSKGTSNDRWSGEIKWDDESIATFNSDPARRLRIKELCVQLDSEGRWDGLVKTMALNGVDYGNAVEDLLEDTIAKVKGEIENQKDSDTCQPLDVLVPDTPDQSQAAIAKHFLSPSLASTLSKTK
jgi:hypothetical protein